ncbi:putative bifunctional diguanylate cyclase/phosphodiesterase [Saccharibacillus alkalitolerans]|uniref:EAL domain-containing protein n=1 Tax=Saccharibacillus alkalitolerans TaxID=2705290 RepID=A0ABX0F1G6_9BACL|nr:GGDEF and EAL domain-containing protein [Saccharibacillus alkalitolerans]NGZ74305.1 EAL domain-containing protein [Saccharibacillus alkalitolerans]
MNDILEILSLNGVYLTIALLGSIAACMLITYGAAWKQSELRTGRVRRRQGIVILLGTAAFSIGHIVAPLSLELPVSGDYYAVHLAFTVLGCLAATSLAIRYSVVSSNGAGRFFLTGLVVSLTILLFDYANVLFLFRDLAVWNPDLVAMTSLLTFCTGFAVIRLITLSNRNREHGLHSRWSMPGIVLAGVALFGVPLLCVLSVLPLDTYNRSGEIGENRAFLFPYLVMLAVVCCLVAVPDEFVRIREKLQSRKIREREQHYISLYEHNPDGVLEFDYQGTVVGMNAQADSLGKKLGKKVLGVRFSDLFVGEQRRIVAEHMKLVLGGRPGTVDIDLKGADGNVQSYSLTSLPIVVDRRVVGAYSIAKNITKRKRDQETIRHLAYHDELTGLANRRSFEITLERYANYGERKPEPFTLLFVDLDRFKRVNDFFGHAFGDLVIQHAGRLIKESIPSNAFLARMGGDEFTVILPGVCSRAEAEKWAGSIVERFTAPFEVGKHTVKLSASVGISRYPEDGVSSELLTKYADSAMYEAKQNGSSQYRFYDAAQDRTSLEEIRLEQELEYAIERNQLRLLYQPKFDIRSGLPIGYEALIRWDHPEHGEISPLRFIPLAEKSGMIVPIEQWVLRTACLQAKRWQAGGRDPLPIAVNVSQVHLMKPDIYESILDTLEETGLDPRLLELEITESAMMHNEEHVIEILDQLKGAGISVSMDDFGTGYSSLSYLHSLPISCLKIDRSFIRKITTDKDSKAIAEMIISMARQLDLKIIAEGVETSEQVALLQELQCYNVQGFYYSRPLPPEQLEREQVS